MITAGLAGLAIQHVLQALTRGGGYCRFYVDEFHTNREILSMQPQ